MRSASGETRVSNSPKRPRRERSPKWRRRRFRSASSLDHDPGRRVVDARWMVVERTPVDGSVGLGECSPLQGLHRETLAESGAQLAVIALFLERVDVSTNVALLNGAFTSWIEDVVGVRSSGELFPSVLRGGIVSCRLHAATAPENAFESCDGR